MPTISEFFGILIRMYYDDHAPPHFHAQYGEYHISVDIKTLAVRDGTFPRRALNLTLDWAELHQQELLLNWERAVQEQPLTKIPPLE